MQNDSGNNILIRRFYQAAKMHSNQTALEIEDKSYSYRQLQETAMNIAAQLLYGAKEHLVGLLAYRSFSAYAGLLGILGAGKGYVPLNPKFPSERSKEMILHSGIDSILVDAQNLEYLQKILIRIKSSLNIFVFNIGDAKPDLGHHKLFIIDDKKSSELPDEDKSEDAIAYLLYTSGSTGKPKGVPVSNRNVCAYLDHMNTTYQFRSSDRFSQTFDLTFDLSVHDLFVCWTNGACLVVPSSDTPFAWSKYIRQKRISVWFSVPSVAVMMEKLRLLKPGSFPDLRLSFFCGEALMLSSAEKWQQAAEKSRLINLYGPSEATIAISEYEMSQSAMRHEMNGILSIGKIFPDQEFMIIDDHKNSLKEGQTGELCLGGSQIINGYFRDQENTRKSFLYQNNTTWYRTGDLAVMANDGRLYFLGRKDSEVKISGYRVNLHEIEHVLRMKMSLETVAAYHESDNKASGLLVLFYTDREMHTGQALQICREVLPWYMVPEKFIFVPAFEYNANGKIDRNSLRKKYL